MVSRLKALLQKHWDLAVYLFFGGLTTLVNYLVYLPCLYWLGLRADVSNCIAWAVAVVFAYVTNKPFVFHSRDWSLKMVAPELGKFAGCRLGSGLLETVLISVTVEGWGWSGLWMKLITSVLVVILNYIASKLLVFRKKD